MDLKIMYINSASHNYSANNISPLGHQNHQGKQNYSFQSTSNNNNLQQILNLLIQILKNIKQPHNCPNPSPETLQLSNSQLRNANQLFFGSPEAPADAGVEIEDTNRNGRLDFGDTRISRNPFNNSVGRTPLTQVQIDQINT